MKTLLLSLALVSSIQTFASTKMDCYQRTYSAAHLRNNPSQEVSYIDLTIVRTGQVIEAHSTIALLGYERAFNLSTGCKPSRDGLRCVDVAPAIDFKISIAGTSARLEIVGATTWDMAETGQAMIIGPNTVDSVFRLKKVSCD